MSGWAGMRFTDWSDLGEVQARLAAGADPDAELDHYYGPPLFMAVHHGSAEVVAELARRVRDVDREHDGRTALWTAVWANKGDQAAALVAAGADLWRPVFGGWSPGRLSRVTGNDGLFVMAPDAPGLTETESTSVARAPSLINVLRELEFEGHSICCVSGMDAAEAVRRLNAEVVEVEWEIDEWYEYSEMIVGVTDVPGGCVVSQPWAYGASMPVVSRVLSAGTVCYAMYANPKSGNQGSAFRDGVMEDWDAHPGGGDVYGDPGTDEVLRTYLYQGHAVAYCCDYAGLTPIDARAFSGPPDVWVEMPAGDYWRMP